jgi:hypothetical protein
VTKPVRFLAIFSFVLLCFLFAGLSHAATLAGKPVQPGGMVEIQFPVAKTFQNVAAEGGNPRPETGRAILMFPPGFDPARRWPILVVTSTSDFNRTSVMDAEWYRKPATAEGWVVLGSDATISPRLDTTQWRLAMLAAALEAVRKDVATSGQVAPGFRGLFRWLETQRHFGSYAGQDRIGQNLWLLS